MIQRTVRFILRMPFFVLLIALGVLALGLYCYKQLDIEAYPNPVPPMIEIITQPNGWSAEEVERYVTVPLENGMSGIIDLDHIRSQSLFGLSDLKCYFSWSADYYTAEQRVLNRLNFVSLPPNLSPQLSPWSAIGEVYRYVVRGDGYPLTDLKTAEDWTLERQFRQAPGVIDVVARPAQRADHARSRAVRTLWPQRRRRRDGRAGGHRRPGGDPGLRGREEVRPDGPLGARLPARPVSASRCRTPSSWSPTRSGCGTKGWASRRGCATPPNGGCARCS